MARAGSGGSAGGVGSDGRGGFGGVGGIGGVGGSGLAGVAAAGRAAHAASKAASSRGLGSLGNDRGGGIGSVGISGASRASSLGRTGRNAISSTRVGRPTGYGGFMTRANEYEYSGLAPGMGQTIGINDSRHSRFSDYRNQMSNLLANNLSTASIDRQNMIQNVIKLGRMMNEDPNITMEKVAALNAYNGEKLAELGEQAPESWGALGTHSGVGTMLGTLGKIFGYSDLEKDFYGKEEKEADAISRGLVSRDETGALSLNATPAISQVVATGLSPFAPNIAARQVFGLTGSIPGALMSKAITGAALGYASNPYSPTTSSLSGILGGVPFGGIDTMLDNANTLSGIVSAPTPSAIGNDRGGRGFYPRNYKNIGRTHGE